MQSRYDTLVERLRRIDSLIVAFSGGADSTLLLRAVRDSGIRAMAITVASPLLPDTELHQARQLANDIGVPHLSLQIDELAIPGFSDNPEDRCYLCKAHRYDRLAELAQGEGYAKIADGSNLDDLQDYRPGMRAVRERGVLTPLVDAELAKHEIRELSRLLGLKTWNRPASPCLATRIPFGSPVTMEKIRMIEHAEECLAQAGFVEFRVRMFDDTARIEVTAEQLPLLLDAGLRDRIVAELRRIGFRAVTIDLEGFRSGKLNPERTENRQD